MSVINFGSPTNLQVELSKGCVCLQGRHSLGTECLESTAGSFLFLKLGYLLLHLPFCQSRKNKKEVKEQKPLGIVLITCG
jgi:hypothetical protein